VPKATNQKWFVAFVFGGVDACPAVVSFLEMRDRPAIV